MLSFETRNRLADLFLSISDGERQIEIVRQILCEQLDFEPYAAFKRIDRSRKGAIDPHDILKFLSDNKIHHAIDHCRAFINRYDVDGDGQLVYNEFLCAVLPMDNPTLRTIATQRPNYDVAEDQLLSYDVEYSLSKIIDREITFYTSLEFQKASLHRCPDFDSLLAFSTINPGPGKINYDRLEAFFHKLAVYPSDDELVALLRRLDRDDDGCLTYDEFAIGVQSIDKSLANTINRSHHRSPTRTHTSPIKSRVFSPSRTIQTTTSDIEVRSPNRAFIESLRRPASPLRTSNILRSTTSPVLNSSLRKAASPRRLLSPSRVISPGRNAANTATMRFNRSSPLQESYAGYAASRSYVEQERVASPVKFAGKESRSGFGSTAATLKIAERASSPFRTTLNNATNRVRGSPLRQSDLVSRSPGMQETLKRSALGESTSGTRMLLKSSEKSILKKNGLYYTMSMSSSDKSQGNFNISARKENKKSSKFESSEAREGLLDTLKQFIQFEKDLEARKQDLALRSDFNLLDFFRVFDVDERGAVSSIEIKEGFERFNVIASKEQLYLFLRRFDRDNDGKLKFSDFAEAFTCKQQEYANLLNNRTPVKGDSGLDLEHPFSESTMSTVAKALRTHLDNEICIEGLRQRLTRRYKFNAHEGFVYLDLKEDGVVTNDEIAEILDKNNCYATQKEVGFVIDRMDINRDGKVTYSEFVQEMTPKSDKSL